MTDVAYSLSFQIDATETRNTIEPARLLAELTHDLRQPLGAIESIAYYLRMLLPRDDERTHAQLEKIQSLVAGMNATLSDATHFLGDAPPNPQVIDLHELISQALFECAPADPQSPPVSLDLADGPLLLKLDASQCRHLVRSLMVLFRQLSDVDAALTIRTSRREEDGGQALLEFHMPGVRLTREQVKALFEPFGTHFPTGAGLCLASTRKIAEANGGRMSAKSDTGRDLAVRYAFPAAS